MNKKHKIRNKDPPIRVAYYAKIMLEKGMDTKEIILILSDKFNKNDLKEFAEKYRYCFYIEGVRHIANLICSIPTKNIDKAMNIFSHSVQLPRSKRLSALADRRLRLVARKN